jgi:hypothetical protein
MRVAQKMSKTRRISSCTLLSLVFAAACGSSSHDAGGTPDAAMTVDGPSATDAEWSPAGAPTPNQVFISSVWGTSPTDVWVTGQADSFARNDLVNAIRWDGAKLTEYEAHAFSVERIFGLDTTHRWVVGVSGTIAAWDAAANKFRQMSTTTQTSTTLGGDFNDLWGTSATDLWAVGSGLGSRARLIHWDGVDWGAADAPAVANSAVLYAIWGTSAADIWAVGDGVFHKAAATTWEKVAVELPVNTSVTDVCGTSPDDVWLVGDRSAVRHKQGATWAAVDIGAPEGTRLTSCAAHGNDVWIAGDLIGGADGGGGAVFHWNGSRWSKQTFRVEGTHHSDYPIVSVGLVGAEAWVADHRGKLFRTQR